MKNILDVYAVLFNLRNALIDDINSIDGDNSHAKVGDLEHFKKPLASESSEQYLERIQRDIADNMTKLSEKLRKKHDSAIMGLVEDAIVNNTLTVLVPTLCGSDPHYLCNRGLTMLLRNNVYYLSGVKVDVVGQHGYRQILAKGNVEVIDTYSC